MPLILDHSIVGQPALTHFNLNKEREWAGCRICGAVFQSPLNQLTPEVYYSDPDIAIAAHLETKEWRAKHAKTHTEKELTDFNQSGMSLTPEAAHKLAPFGFVSVSDAALGPPDSETNDALGTAPRAPLDSPEETIRKERKYRDEYYR